MSRRYRQITCKSALHKLHSSRLPYTYDLNIYRGCAHDCRYCFAMYTHDYMEDTQFFDTIYIKTNICDRLERQLSSPSWKRDIINLGGITDSYQPIERKQQIMPEILKLLIKYRTPCIISTKSDLILRDFDLIDRLSRITYVNIACTITTLDEGLRKKLEPGGVSSSKRFAVLKAFSGTKVRRGLHMMPLIPYLTDTTENLEGLYREGVHAGVTYALPGLLSLKGKTRKAFFDFLRLEYPDLIEPFNALYRQGRLDKAYCSAFYRRLHLIRKKYGLPLDYRPQKPDEGEQLSLF